MTEELNLNILQLKIMAELKKGKRQRDELAKVLNVARTTIYDNITPLLKLGFVKVEEEYGHIGRPPKYYFLNDNL